MARCFVRLLTAVPLLLPLFLLRPLSTIAQQDPDELPVMARRVIARLEPRVRFLNGPAVPLTLADRMRYYRVPGVSIAVVDDGGIAWSAGFGATRADKDSRVTSGTPFAAKSIAKPIAAAIALKLVDARRLTLDAPLAERLTSLTIPDNEFSRRTAPTLRHLLAHAAGFTRGGVDSYRPDEAIPSLLESLRGVAPARVEPVTIDYEPGTDTRYSGGGYGVLQQLLVDVTGMPFAALADSLLFDPLHMDQSRFPDGRLPEAVLRYAALGHDDQGAVLPGGYQILPIQAAGGLWTTAEDLARFLVAWTAAWHGEQGPVEPATARAMATRQFDDQGLGFEIEDHREELAVLHTGSGDGFKAVIVAYPESRDGAVVLANGDGAGELRYEILRAIAREYGWPGFHDAASYTLAEVPGEELARRTGSYRWESGLESEVELRDGRLFYRFPGGAWQELFPVGPDRMVTTADETYVFGPNDSLTYLANGSSFSAERVAP